MKGKVFAYSPRAKLVSEWDAIHQANDIAKYNAFATMNHDILNSFGGIIPDDFKCVADHGFNSKSYQTLDGFRAVVDVIINKCRDIYASERSSFIGALPRPVEQLCPMFMSHQIERDGKVFFYL